MNRRDFARLGGAALAASLALPARASAGPGREPPSTLHYVAPELRPAARQLIAMLADHPPLSDQSLAAARAWAPLAPDSLLPDIPIQERKVPVGKTNRDVTVYVINAKAGEQRPAILHTHGGGYVLGSAKSERRRLQDVARELGCVIVSVEYRLAPETRYTGSVEDNYAGLWWMHAQARELGIDRTRIAVMGESAGGGHAALLAIAARCRSSCRC